MRVLPTISMTSRASSTGRWIVVFDRELQDLQEPDEALTQRARASLRFGQPVLRLVTRFLPTPLLVTWDQLREFWALFGGGAGRMVL